MDTTSLTVREPASLTDRVREVTRQLVARAGVELWRGLRDYCERRALLRALGRLEPWQLRDIGVTRADLEAIAENSLHPAARRRLGL